MKPLRALFAFEALITAVSGVWALVEPTSFSAQFAEPPTGAALDFIRWIGATWLVLATVESMCLRQSKRGPWVPVLTGMLLGDLLHVLGALMMIHHGGVLGLASVSGVVLTIVFALGRVAALEDLGRLDR